MSRKRERSEVSLVTLAEQRCSAAAARAHRATAAAADAMRVASAIDSACDTLPYAESLAAVFAELGLRRDNLDPDRSDYFPDWSDGNLPFVRALRSYAYAGLLCVCDDYSCECVTYLSRQRAALVFSRFLRGTPASAAAQRALARHVKAHRRLLDRPEMSDNRAQEAYRRFMDVLGATPLAAALTEHID